jgi:hypothetical protein
MAYSVGAAIGAENSAGTEGAGSCTSFATVSCIGVGAEVSVSTPVTFSGTGVTDDELVSSVVLEVVPELSSGPVGKGTECITEPELISICLNCSLVTHTSSTHTIPWTLNRSPPLPNHDMI